ncbi:MAG: hypothetical protein J6W08_02280 [Alphaproteobacteria bacterium]|nr:hypothetical protein [Alphaproteobacteria bacterium]
MFTKIDLCSMALLKLGEKPIQSWREDSASAQLSRTLFEPVTDTLLATFPWRFATQSIVLTKNTDGDFLIPANVLRVLKCEGQITGNTINTSGDSLEISAIVKTEPEDFPGYFATLVATKLAVEFCIPLIGDANVFKMMTALYESEFQSAKFIDSTSSNQSNINDFSLISSRF